MVEIRSNQGERYWSGGSVWIQPFPGASRDACGILEVHEQGGKIAMTYTPAKKDGKSIDVVAESSSCEDSFFVDHYALEDAVVFQVYLTPYDYISFPEELLIIENEQAVFLLTLPFSLDEDEWGDIVVEEVRIPNDSGASKLGVWIRLTELETGDQCVLFCEAEQKNDDLYQGTLTEVYRASPTPVGTPEFKLGEIAYNQERLIHVAEVKFSNSWQKHRVNEGIGVEVKDEGPEETEETHQSAAWKVKTA